MITVEHAVKMFGALAAVNDVSFSLKPDEIIGFVGPNGSGKSTLMRMLATYLYPTSGRLSVAGFDVVDHPIEARANLGYLPGDTPLYADMRVGRFLEFIGRAQGLSGAGLRGRLDWVIARCALTEVLAKRIKACSTGFRKRIGLAAALIHDPQVLLLDEPTHGLDPLQILAWRELLRDLRPGRTILLSSHVISEVATVCDRLLIINEGRLLADGRVDELLRAEGLSSNELEELFLRVVRRYYAQEKEATHAV